MTTEIEYRTRDTTDKNEIRVGDRVTFSRDTNPKMGQVTGVAYFDHEDVIGVADYVIRSKFNTLHKIERPVTPLPTKPGLYTPAPKGAPVENYRVFTLSQGYWQEGEEDLDEDDAMFEYVREGIWILRRLVVEGD